MIDDGKKRCPWCNLNNPLYVEYHDKEWGVLNLDDSYLYEMFLLECFQAGLSWQCILNKREAFRKAYDDFDIAKVCSYNENKIAELLNNKDLVRNKLKIKASIFNSKVFKNIQEEFGSFSAYLLSFSKGKIFYETDRTTSPLSDALSQDLIKRGAKFVGSVTIYSYLQAVGIINSHSKECFLFQG